MLTPSLDYYMRFLMEYMCMDFFKGKWPCVFQTTKFTNCNALLSCPVSSTLQFPQLRMLIHLHLCHYTHCASLQDLGHMAQLISVLLDCSSDNCEFSPWLPCSDSVMLVLVSLAPVFGTLILCSQISWIFIASIVSSTH